MTKVSQNDTIRIVRDSGDLPEDLRKENRV